MTGLNSAARQLRDAYLSGQIPPMRDFLGPADDESAYRIQTINTRYWESRGRRIVGRKIGLTAKAVQTQLGVSQPDYGVLFDDMIIEDGGTLAALTLLQPRAEAEVALILGADISGPGIDRNQLTDSIQEVRVAIEVVDSRILDWNITFADTVADNGSSAFFVIGGDRSDVRDVDLWTCGMILEKNEEIASVGVGAACLGHPLNSALWLARTLAERGEPLRRGDVILTGALGPMVSIKPGDRIRATVAGLGTVSFSYASEPA